MPAGTQRCAGEAVADARAACDKLGIPYDPVDESDEFRRQVVHYLAAEYQAGRTPNPCVVCNEHLKFGRLLQRAERLGAQCVATGHFARLGKSADGARTFLKRGRDLRKDQSYFLFSLRQEQLARALFPLGESEAPRPATGHHSRPGRRLLRGRLGPGRGLDSPQLTSVNRGSRPLGRPARLPAHMG